MLFALEAKACPGNVFYLRSGSGAEQIFLGVGQVLWRSQSNSGSGDRWCNMMVMPGRALAQIFKISAGRSARGRATAAAKLGPGVWNA